jgi:LPS-assembly lipoprotein
MSSSDRRIFLLGLTALAGCGFEPVYAPGAAGRDLRGRIDIAEPVDEAGFALVRRLEERLGRANGADLVLNADIRIGEDPVGYLPDGTISRYNVIGEVDWRLVNTADGEIRLSGSERSFSSYSATSTTVATIFAQRDAQSRLMIGIADRIVADILARLDTP